MTLHFKVRVARGGSGTMRGTGNGTTYANNGTWWNFTVTGGLGPQGGESVDDATRVGRRTPGGTVTTRKPA